MLVVTWASSPPLSCPLLTAFVAMPPDCPAQVVAVVGRNKGLILMCPPKDSADARTSLAAMTSAIKPKTKVVVAESFGGKDEPIDGLLRSLVDVGAEVRRVEL